MIRILLPGSPRLPCSHHRNQETGTATQGEEGPVVVGQVERFSTGRRGRTRSPGIRPGDVTYTSTTRPGRPHTQTRPTCDLPDVDHVVTPDTLETAPVVLLGVVVDRHG